MPPELRKRKATSTSSPQAKKSKKDVDTTKKEKVATVTAKKEKATAPPVKKEKIAAPSAKKEKIAAVPAKKEKVAASSAKKQKTAAAPAKKQKDTAPPAKKAGGKMLDRGMKKSKAASPVSTSESALEAEDEEEEKEDAISLNVDGPDSGSEAESEADDQTTTLLQGFESSDDEAEDATTGENIDAKKLAKAGIPDETDVNKKLEGLKGKEKSTPGIIYLGRIPHGFYEHEMRSYFSQFGTVTRLRLSRNKKTGRSKHYAFIEFSDGEVAQIVADTMNNYLLFGHILKCKIVPRDNIEYVEQLFKGANKRFKPKPAAKIAKALMEKKRPEQDWAKKVDAENRRRKKINSRLQAKGIEYEFEAPLAKKADKVEAEVVVQAS